MVLQLTTVARTHEGRTRLYIRIRLSSRLVVLLPKMDLRRIRQQNSQEFLKDYEDSRHSAAYRAWLSASAPIPSTPSIA